MVKIIETNLSLSWDYQIKDHQSRMIEVNSWEEYCEAFKEYDGKPIEFKSLTTMIGATIPSECVLSYLRYDDHHLFCSIKNKFGIFRKLAYLVRCNNDESE